MCLIGMMEFVWLLQIITFTADYTVLDHKNTTNDSSTSCSNQQFALSFIHVCWSLHFVFFSSIILCVTTTVSVSSAVFTAFLSETFVPFTVPSIKYTHASCPNARHFHLLCRGHFFLSLLCDLWKISAQVDK